MLYDHVDAGTERFADDFHIGGYTLLGIGGLCLTTLKRRAVSACAYRSTFSRTDLVCVMCLVCIQSCRVPRSAILVALIQVSYFARRNPCFESKYSISAFKERATPGPPPPTSIDLCFCHNLEALRWKPPLGTLLSTLQTPWCPTNSRIRKGDDETTPRQRMSRYSQKRSEERPVIATTLRSSGIRYRRSH